MTEEDRHSRALEPEIISDPVEKARKEAANGLRQIDAVNEMIEAWLQPDRPFKLRLSHILHLHRFALEGLSSYAGNFRPAQIEIGGSKHQPVEAFLVPEKIEELCDDVNQSCRQKSPIYLAAYVLWRLNWIHPFTDGNGRTARALAYLVLCVALGIRLPGTNTIPEQISTKKQPYYAALEAADLASQGGVLDLTEMEKLLSALLAEQLVSVHKSATESR